MENHRDMSLFAYICNQELSTANEEIVFYADDGHDTIRGNEQFESTFICTEYLATR